MPLLKVETRTKASEDTEQVAEGGTVNLPRRAGDRPGSAQGGASIVALLLGALAALIVLGAVSLILVRRFGLEGAPAARPSSPGEMGGSALAPGVSGVTFGPRPAPALNHVPVLNVDYPRDSVIAVINGEPYTMAHLEASVRVARSLGTLSADAVPSFQDATALRAFQVDMLKRQIDIILIRQSAMTQSTLPPDISPVPAVQGFLQVVGATESQLDDALASNGATQAHLDAWFADAALVDYFIQTNLMVGQDPGQRAEVAQAWINAAWASSDIQISFYEPEDG